MVCPHVAVGASGKDKKCGRPLAQNDVLACLRSQEERDRYLLVRLTLSRAVDQQDNMGCCPTAGCSFQFEWDDDNRKLDCPLCNQTYCLVCQTGPWHTGIRCEQFQQQRKEAGGDEGGDGNGSKGDDAFRKFASKQKLKQCPKCKFWVEKSHGCDAMHCRGCLRGTAKKNGFKECKCAQSQSVMEVHENAPHHNLNPNPDPLAAMAGVAPPAFGGMIPPWPNGVPPPMFLARYGADGRLQFPGQGQRLGGGSNENINKRARVDRK